jgi:Golgi-body localisation protein domain
VQDFVFTLPTIEYRNRTWSYIDLAMHLKKGTFTSIRDNLMVDVFKAILSHSGMLIRDKISFHRKPKPQSQLVRQLSSYRSYTHLNDLVTDDRSTPDVSSSEAASRKSSESLPALRHTGSAISLRNGVGYLSPLGGHARHDSDEDKSSGNLKNALTTHLKNISHLARHGHGIGDESEESSVRKTKLLLGKFGGK